MKLTIFGDSRASGLGVRDGSYAGLLAERYGLELNVLAAPSAMVTDSLALLDEAAGSELVLAMHGGTEGLIRPTTASLRFMPPRWRKRGWMDPRAYFSSKWYKRIPQRIESAVRWRVKVLLIRLTGGECMLGLEEYRAASIEFIERLQGLGVKEIVLIGCAGYDARFFPGSADNIARYDQVNTEIAARYGLTFIPLLGVCHKWDEYFEDHLHPNFRGHQRIADVIDAQITANRVERNPDSREAESINAA